MKRRPKPGKRRPNVDDEQSEYDGENQQEDVCFQNGYNCSMKKNKQLKPKNKNENCCSCCNSSWKNRGGFCFLKPQECDRGKLPFFPHGCICTTIRNKGWQKSRRLVDLRSERAGYEGIREEFNRIDYDEGYTPGTKKDMAQLEQRGFIEDLPQEYGLVEMQEGLTSRKREMEKKSLKSNVEGIYEDFERAEIEGLITTSSPTAKIVDKKSEKSTIEGIPQEFGIVDNELAGKKGSLSKDMTEYCGVYDENYDDDGSCGYRRSIEPYKNQQRICCNCQKFDDYDADDEFMDMETETVNGCDCFSEEETSFCRKILGPTPDETIIRGIQTFMDFWFTPQNQPNKILREKTHFNQQTSTQDDFPCLMKYQNMSMKELCKICCKGEKRNKDDDVNKDSLLDVVDKINNTLKSKPLKKVNVDNDNVKRTNYSIGSSSKDDGSSIVTVEDNLSNNQRETKSNSSKAESKSADQNSVLGKNQNINIINKNNTSGILRSNVTLNSSTNNARTTSASRNNNNNTNRSNTKTNKSFSSKLDMSLSGKKSSTLAVRKKSDYSRIYIPASQAKLNEKAGAAAKKNDDSPAEFKEIYQSDLENASTVFLMSGGTKKFLNNKNILDGTTTKSSEQKNVYNLTTGTLIYDTQLTKDSTRKNTNYNGSTHSNNLSNKNGAIVNINDDLKNDRSDKIHVNNNNKNGTNSTNTTNLKDSTINSTFKPLFNNCSVNDDNNNKRTNDTELIDTNNNNNNNGTNTNTKKDVKNVVHNTLPKNCSVNNDHNNKRSNDYKLINNTLPKNYVVNNDFEEPKRSTDAKLMTNGFSTNANNDFKRRNFISTGSSIDSNHFKKIQSTFAGTTGYKKGTNVNVKAKNFKNSNIDSEDLIRMVDLSKRGSVCDKNKNSLLKEHAIWHLHGWQGWRWRLNKKSRIVPTK